GRQSTSRQPIIALLSLSLIPVTGRNAICQNLCLQSVHTLIKLITLHCPSRVSESFSSSILPTHHWRIDTDTHTHTHTHSHTHTHRETSTQKQSHRKRERERERDKHTL